MGKQQVKSKKSRKSNPRNAIQKEKNVQSRHKKKKKQQQNQSNPLEDNATQKEKNVQARLKKKKKQQQNQSNPLEDNATKKEKNVQARLKKKKQQQQNQSNPLEDNVTQKEKNVQARLKKKKKQQQNQSNPLEDNDPILHESDDDGAVEEEKLAPEDLQPLLEEYSKDQLITFLTDAAADDPSLLSHFRSLADHHRTHRTIFIRGFGWDVTAEDLIKAFRPYGPIVDSYVVVDKASGLSKGHGFVVFSSRSGAVKALKDPEKKIGARMASCQQSLRDNVATSNSSTDLAQRRVYVGNVHAEINPDKLKAFFDTFGEIESGTYGLDPLTGKLRSFAIFIYKTLDGASKALHEPYKMFEGHELYCKLAINHSQKGKLPVTPVAPQSLPIINQQPALNAMAAAQNVAYNTFAQNPLFNNAAFNSNSFSALNPAALAALNPTANLVTPQGLGYGAHDYGGQGLGGVGVGLGGSNAFGTYRTQESTGLSYGGYQLGQSSSLAPATGFYRSFPQ